MRIDAGRVFELAEQGWTTPRVAQELKVSTASLRRQIKNEYLDVWQKLLQNRKDANQRLRRDVDLSLVQELAAAGASYVKIAHRCSVSVPTLRSFLRIHDPELCRKLGLEDR
jgi:AraC-like DNA-binding protein